MVEDPQLLGALAQFGTAGLVGALWLAERRSALDRERQIAEAHRSVTAEREHAEALVSVVRSNTRALTALESGQRRLAAAIERLTDRAAERAAVAAGERAAARGPAEAEPIRNGPAQ